MAVGWYWRVVCILMILTNIQCGGEGDGPFIVECLDHNFMITVLLSSEDIDPLIEAIDVQGRYPIPQGGNAQCGYTYSVYKRLGVAVLRASYFSCYTELKDKTFTFTFQLSLNGLKKEVHRISKACSPSWFHREITCEENYIEVSVQTDISWQMQSLADAKIASALPKVYETATSVWQIMFLRDGNAPAVLSVADAASRGYFLEVTPSRIVFRTAHEQPHSITVWVNGLAIENIRPVVFLRQGFRTIIVDLSASCTLTDYSYNAGALIWNTLTTVSPMVSTNAGFQSKNIGIGVEGRRMDPNVAAERGIQLNVGPEVVQVSIPYGAQGGLRKSFLMDNMYHEFYAVSLFYEHVFTTDGGALESRLHYVKVMTTPALFRAPFTSNLTVLQEHIFTVHVGDFPFDVELTSVRLNGMKMTVQEATRNGYRISKIPNGYTHGYTIYVPFEDPVVRKMYLGEGVLEYSLDLNYTFHILPQEGEYFYLTTVVARIMGVYPPYFNGLCMEKGIRFSTNQQMFASQFETGIGPYLLTQKLANVRGYIMTNNNQSLTLDVPLFTIGYKYEAVSLEQFYATFEIVVRDTMSQKLIQSLAKTCRFPTTEMLVCSPNGTVTVVADLTKAKPNPFTSKTTLLDKTCTPREVDEKRALFEFSLNSCGTRFWVTNDFLTYENEIVFEEASIPREKPVITRDSAYRIILQCIYPVYGVDRLVIDRQFRSQTPGKGTMQVQRPLNSPVTVAPKVSTTTIRKATTTTPVPTLAQPPSIKLPVKYMQMYGWARRGGQKVAT